MPCPKIACTMLFIGMLLSPALAQNSTQPPARSKATARSAQSAPANRAPMTEGVPTGQGTTGSVPLGRNSTAGQNRVHREPCWQVAGVSKAAMQQRHAIAMQTRQEIESVCANSSISVTQKRERIRQIRQQERQQVDGLISPQQQAAIRACQEQRGGHVGGGHLGGGHGTGPCGTMPGFGSNETENESAPRD